jgi:uncharacterized protein
MILIHPGLGNSGEQHWQTIWERQHPEFVRVYQKDWETPVCADWIAQLDETVTQFNLSEVVIVGHSLACVTIVQWAKKYQRIIKGALLVAPSDTEAASYPLGTKGFCPMLMEKLTFKTIVVGSTNDPYVTVDRVKQFAEGWGSELVWIGDAGHINAASGYGDWPFGLELLKRLY